ncbi:MAG: Daunorubicin/doxorubicin resistance ATP-binding protein DrrA [Acidimicrobiales bacterium]|nr:Daunorubicin/doxorubicin resistance ATP-binding protein DrrA [Acidimicrobiales bacterium]
MPAIEVNDLTIRYGDLTAVDQVVFTAEAGEVTVVLGPNGAGKTSTIECLEGYRRPTSGSVRVLGLDPFSDRSRLLPRIGVMLQEGGVYTGIRVGEVVQLFAAYHRDPLDPGELVDRVGLSSKARTTWRRLSGGEQQRLSLALALVGRPSVAFLDEPTAGVDVEGRLLIREIVRDLVDRGVCVLLATHDLEEAEKLADHVIIIDHGEVVAAGRPLELVAGETDHILFSGPSTLDLEGLGAAVGGKVVELSVGEYRVEIAPDPANVAAVTSWLAARDLAIADLRAGRQRLDDVFLRLTRSRPVEGTARGNSTNSQERAQGPPP